MQHFIRCNLASYSANKTHTYTGQQYTTYLPLAGDPSLAFICSREKALQYISNFFYSSSNIIKIIHHQSPKSSQRTVGQWKQLTNGIPFENWQMNYQHHLFPNIVSMSTLQGLINYHLLLHETKLMLNSLNNHIRSRLNCKSTAWGTMKHLIHQQVADLQQRKMHSNVLSKLFIIA